MLPAFQNSIAIFGKLPDFSRLSC